MGIKGIYHEIGPGQRIALSKLAVETFEQKGRPLRLAIDVSIWLFQIQSGRGGTNPALRTFYYRLLRLFSLSIHPLFVFDGPNKPPFKRNKRTGPNVASIPEFLAKQLLKQFGLTFHIASGEAEAECAHLQRKGVVDAVLSEDVDTLMFGSGLTLRNWSSDTKGSPTHVNLYDAVKTKETAGLDREGMILVALMSGGDYIPEGIPGCGPRTACQAARAGFGTDLCAIKKDDADGLASWKDRLKHELATNESRYFQRKIKALDIPEDFPRRDVLRYYTHPCLSTDERVDNLKTSLKWDQDIDFDALRVFTGEAFEWICVGGAKKFIRNLAPALLVRQLRLRGESGRATGSDDPDTIAEEERRLVKTIDKRRNHVTTDGTSELKIGFTPHDLVPIDLDAEDPDPELPLDGLESDAEAVPDLDGEPTSPKKKRAASQYDPTILEKIWVLETYVTVGVPLMTQDWEESFRNVRKYEEMKAQRRQLGKAKGQTKKAVIGGMRGGALDPFAKSMKPGVSRSTSMERDILKRPSSSPKPVAATRTIPDLAMEPKPSQPPAFRIPPSTLPEPDCAQSSEPEMVDLSLSPAKGTKEQRFFRRSRSVVSAAEDNEGFPSTTLQAPVRTFLEPLPELPPSVTKRRRRTPIRRTQTLPDAGNRSLSPPSTHQMEASKPPSPFSHAFRNRTSSSSKDKTLSPPNTPKRNRTPFKPQEPISLLTSSPAPATPQHRQRSIAEWLTPSTRKIQAKAEPEIQTKHGSPTPKTPRFAAKPAATAVASVIADTDGSRDDDPFLDGRGNDREQPPEPPSQASRQKPKEKSRRALRAISGNEAAVSDASDNLGLKEDQPSAPPKFRDPRPSAFRDPQITVPAASASHQPPAAVERISTSIQPTRAPQPGAPMPNPALTKISKYIRLRDSLPGTYAIEVLDMTGHNADPGKAPTVAGRTNAAMDASSNGQKRKAPFPTGANTGATEEGRGGKGRSKRWRISQVEVLDLTEA